jgi:hypothetical protein
MHLQSAKDGKFMEALNNGLYLLKYVYSTVRYFREHEMGSKQGKQEGWGGAWS